MAQDKKTEELRAPPLPLVPPFSLRGGIKDLYFYKHTRTEGEYARHLWKLQLALIIVLILIAYFFYTNLRGAPAAPTSQPTGIILSTDRTSYYQNDIITLKGTSNNCSDEASIFLDTDKVASINITLLNATFFLNLSAPGSIGAHVIHAESGACSSSVQISVLERRCVPGERRPCRTDEGCEGTQVCTDFGLSGCVLNRVCTPGERAVCSYDACNSGYKICNPCGTGYGGCINPNLQS